MAERIGFIDEIFQALYNMLMFLYVVSVIVSFAITLLLTLVTCFAFTKTCIDFCLLPLGIFLSFLSIKPHNLSRNFVIYYFLVYITLNILIRVHAFFTITNYYHRRNIVRIKTEQLTFFSLSIIFIESGFWILNFLSIFKRLVLFSLYFHVFLGEQKLFDNRMYDHTKSRNLKKYFEQAGQLPYVICFDTTLNLMASW